MGWVCWSISGKLISSSCSDCTARVWDADTGSQLAVLTHPEPVQCAELSRDDRLCITACDDNKLRVWSVAERRLLTEVDPGMGQLHAAVESPDGGAILAAGEHGIAVYVLAVADDMSNAALTLRAEWKQPVVERRRPRWSNDSSRIAVPSPTGVEILDAGSCQALDELLSAGRSFRSVDWGPRDESLIVGTDDGELQVWALSSKTLETSTQGHSSWVWDVKCAEDHSVVMSAGVDGYACFWEGATLEPLSRIGQFTRGISAVEWSPDADRILSSSADGILVLWDVNRRRAVAEHNAHSTWIRSIRWRGDTTEFLSASQDGSVCVWEATHDGGGISELSRNDQLDAGGLWDAIWTPDGRIACVSETGRLIVFDPKSPENVTIRRFESSDWLRGIACSSNNEFFAISSNSGWVRCMVNDPSGLRERWKVEPGSKCFGVAISPDSRLVAVALANSNVALLSAADGSLVRTLSGHESEVWSVSFAPGGAELASSGADGSVRVWKVDTGDTRRSFKQLSSCVGVRYSPAGDLVFGASGAWIVDPKSAESEPGSMAATLTDSPASVVDDPSAVDLLGRMPLVDEMAFFLYRTSAYAKSAAGELRQPDGFSLLISGRWGTGKSTLARQLSNLVSPDTEAPGVESEWLSVEYSAWSNAGLGPAWWTIASTIRERILEGRSRWARKKFLWKELNWRYPRLLLHLLSLALAAVALALVLALLDPFGHLGDWLSSASKSEATNVAAPWASVIAIAIPLLSGLAIGVKAVANARRRWRWPVRQGNTIDLSPDAPAGELPNRYVNWLRSQAEKDILLIVDDLDRCDGAVGCEVLTALHVISRSERRNDEHSRVKANGNSLAIVVLADRHWLELAVEDRAGAASASLARPGKSYGAAYLEKFFIGHVCLPSLVTEQRAHLVRYEGVEVPVENATIDPADHGVTLRSLSASGAVGAVEAALTPAVAEFIPTSGRSNSEAMHNTMLQRMQDLAMLAEAEGRLLEDYAEFMDSTPRGVKRTLVGFWLNRAIAHSIPCEPAIEDDDVMRWTILETRWPTLLYQLRNQDPTSWMASAEATLGGDFDSFKRVVDGMAIAQTFDRLSA